MTSYQQPSTADADPSLKDKASEAVDQSKHAASDVASSATERAQEVAHEATQQARDLVGEARQHVTRQAGEQHQNLVTNLRSLSTELGSMVERSDQNGTATQLVSQARDRVDGVASWLDGRQPGEIVDEVRSFARRRPGTFLLGALAAGVVVGRLTRGAVAAHTEDSGSTSTPTPTYPPTESIASTNGLAGAPYEPASGYAHSTGASTYDQPVPGFAQEPGANASGYSMGGSYAQPAEGERPVDEQGYGATSTYGDTGTQPYPAGGFTNGGQR